MIKPKESHKIRQIKFYLPGYYLFYTRLTRKSERASWIIVFPLAVLMVSLLADTTDWLAVLGIFALSFLGWLSIYELGYMENDGFTIERETQPTYRMTKGEIKFIKNNFNRISGIRVLFFLLITCLLYYSWQGGFSLTYYLLIIALTRMVFYFHNQLRSRWNILSYFLLSLGKYSFLAVILFQFNFPILLGALVLAFPLPRTLEHACKVKYRLRSLKNLVGEMDDFRVRYYGFLVFVAGIVLFAYQIEEFAISLVLFTYFFLFRTMAWFLIKFGNYSRSQFEVHQWDKN